MKNLLLTAIANVDFQLNATVFNNFNLFDCIFFYSAFQIDELHRHNQNLVGTFHATSLLWSTDMKTAVSSAQPYLNSLKNWQFF